MFVRAVNPRKLALASPMLAGDQAFRLFCRPDLSPYRSVEQDVLVARARYHLKRADWQQVPTPVGRVQCYVFAPAGEVEARGTIVLVHGWTSEASFMSAFIEPLRQCGFRLILVDLPAHGKSGPRSATMIDCARALLAVCEHFAPVAHVVAHSIGCLVALVTAEGQPSLDRAYRFERMAFISCPNAFSDITESFARHLGLSRAALRWFEHHLARVGRRDVRRFAAATMLAPMSARLLVVHSRDDDRIGYHAATQIAAVRPDADLLAVDGLGHARVLYAPPVVRAVRTFLTKD